MTIAQLFQGQSDKKLLLREKKSQGHSSWVWHLLGDLGSQKHRPKKLIENGVCLPQISGLIARQKILGVPTFLNKIKNTTLHGFGKRLVT